MVDSSEKLLKQVENGINIVGFVDKRWDLVYVIFLIFAIFEILRVFYPLSRNLS